MKQPREPIKDVLTKSLEKLGLKTLMPNSFEASVTSVWQDLIDSKRILSDEEQKDVEDLKQMAILFSDVIGNDDPRAQDYGIVLAMSRIDRLGKKYAPKCNGSAGKPGKILMRSYPYDDVHPEFSDCRGCLVCVPLKL